MDVDTVFGEVLRLHAGGDLATAETMYRRILAVEPKHAPTLHYLGIVAYQRGDLDTAARLIRQSLAIEPNSPEASNNLGLVLKDQGKFADAAEAFRLSIQLRPGAADVHHSLGLVLESLGREDEAEAGYRRAVALAPDHADAHADLGAVLQGRGLLPEAEASYRTSLALRPGRAEVHNNLGVVLTELGRLDEAVASCRKALDLKPDYVEALGNLGAALQAGEAFADAASTYRQAIALAPGHAQMHSNLGCALRSLGRIDEAIACHRRAIALGPNLAMAYANLGTALADTDWLDDGGTMIALKADAGLSPHEEAVAMSEKAIELDPRSPKAYGNLGGQLQTLGRRDEAIAYCRKAIALNPGGADPHVNLALVLLGAGRVGEGLEEYEWRWHQSDKRGNNRGSALMCPVWDGVADLTGKSILVWGEQGLADQIKWSAHLPEIIGRAGTCIVECTPKLVPLLARSFPGADVRPTDRTSDPSRTDFDYHVPMGSLFRVMGATARRTEIYLFPDPERVAFWRARLASLGAGPFVGIAWTSSVLKPGRLQGYTGIAEWAPVFATPGAVFINLQHGDRAADLEDAKVRFGVTVHDFADIDLFDDLADVAALATVLDVGICVGTAVAAIVAGVGTPLWRLTWRQDSTNNVLYTPPGPSVDYFHRDTGENWSVAFAEIARRLEAL